MTTKKHEYQKLPDNIILYLSVYTLPLHKLFLSLFYLVLKFVDVFKLVSREFHR